MDQLKHKLRIKIHFHDSTSQLEISKENQPETQIDCIVRSIIDFWV